MLGLAVRIGSTLRAGAAPVIGLIWSNWTTGWTSLNNTWNSYN